jgi:hypothetical protein
VAYSSGLFRTPFRNASNSRYISDIGNPLEKLNICESIIFPAGGFSGVYPYCPPVNSDLRE